MNNFKVYIDNENLTNKATFPLKWADLLDERLDEVRFTIKNLEREEPFAPLTLLVIELTVAPQCKVTGERETNNPHITQVYDSKTHTLTQTMTKRYVIATDTVNQYPIGTKLHTHEIYAIEETKLLEGFIGDSITFTNPLGNVYVKNS